MKVRRAIISIILILSILASTVVMLRMNPDKEEVALQEAQAATFDDSGKIEYLSATDASMVYGTEQNPFTVLEIVPYAGYAEIGYLIGGKEPVDMARLSAVSLGTVSSDSISASAAKEFIEYLAEKHYMTLLTEEEAIICNAKDAELPAEKRKFACYQFMEKQDEDTKCYVTNKNSFLRESIGLKYVTEGNKVNYNNFDIDRYEFMGWFEEGTDMAFDFSERLFCDVTVYAKWRLVKSDGTAIEPVMVTPAPEAIVPAEGYDSGITVRFAEYIPTSLQGEAGIEGLPPEITNVMTDGTVGGSKLTEPAEPVLTGIPEADNYILRGWYLDKSGTTPYEFGSAIPSSYIVDGVMTLYPWWVQKEDCRITFDAALPDEYMIPGNTVRWPSVLSNAENGSGEEIRYLNTENGSRMEAENVPQLYLLGNVDYKVKHYVLDVVTATPQELNAGGNVGDSFDEDASLDNLALIEKANIIMLSPQSHFYDTVMPISSVIELSDNNNNKIYHRFGEDGRTPVDIWRDCVNPALFEFTEVPQEGDTGTYGFLHNDLCWEVILAIFKETVLAEPKAALIYDAESYHMALMNGSGATSESPKKLLFGEKTSINVESLTGRNHSNLANSNNVYKLYLMMNQMNPQLFYATFLKEHIYAKMNGSISTGCYNWSENTGEISNEVIYWNTATFLLCLLLDEADGNIWIEDGIIKLKGNPWEKWGVTLDVHTLSDNLDDATGDPNKEYGLVKGNCFTYESDVVNITEYFATNASIPYQRHVYDVYEYYDRDDDSITMSEIVHYLIQIAKGETEDTLPGAGYDKDIRILEVQPSESYLSPITWLWNINTYIDGFAGTTEITQQSSAEFIGKIEDLNSTYDLVYIGSDVSNYASTRTVIAKELLDTYADEQTKWYDAGSTVILAEGQVVSHQKVVEYEMQAGETLTLALTQPVKVVERKQIPAGTYLIEVDQSQNLQVSQLIEPDGERKYDEEEVYKKLQQGQVINLQVKAGDTIVTTSSQNMDVLKEEMKSGVFTSPVTQTVLCYHTVEEWLPAGTEVVLAEGCSLRALVNVPPEVKIQPYSYFHTGAKVDMSLNNNIELTGILGGNADRVNEYYYSGNDITKVRMQEILEFAAAGYPVVIASRLMKRNAEGTLEVNTTVVDSASNMYLLLTELAAGEHDETSPYYGNLFYEGTETTDENYLRYKRQLLEALTETKCELTINRMPVLYANDKSTAESYLNGAAGKENEKTIEIAFTIADVEDAYYHLNFYIDQNADGRYAASERLVGKLKIYEVVLGRTQEVTQLKPNRNYTLEANLEDYVGVIPWKLEIVRSDNTVIRDSVIECCAILPTAAQKPVLHVLQVVPALVYDANGNVTQCSSIYLPTTADMQRLEWAMSCWEDIGQGKNSAWTEEQKAAWNAFWAGKDITGHTVESLTENLKWEYGEWTRGGRLNDYVVDRMYVSPGLSHLFMGAMLESIPYDEGSGGRRRSAVGFWLYIRSVADFSITVDRMTIEEFITTTAVNKAKDNGDVSAWALEDYDMMILGFSDAYPDISNDDALKVIEDFCAAGKQILFTHDTTSFRNYTQGSEQYSSGIYWGYNINREFRDILGMDRFGATLMYPLDINGNLLNNGLSITDAITKKKDAPYKNGMTQDVSSQEKILENVLNTSVYGVVKYYVHGYSDSLLYRFSSKRYTQPLNTQCASKVNVGQLTEYPYRIGDEIMTAVTHEPYYQLDMEAEDIVVWYALEATPGDMTASTDYAGAHHDVRNNYYLYSRGNIIYTGLGHNSYLTKDELKLFVNTFVASYRIEADPPVIEVQNSNATTAESEYFYIDFDSWDETYAVGSEIIKDELTGEQFQRVRFVVKEAVALRNLKMTMEYYLTAALGEGAELTERTGTAGVVKQSGYIVSADAEDNPVEITVNAAKLNTYRSSDGVQVTEQEIGMEYYVDIPVSLMEGTDGAELLFRAVLNYGRQNDQYVYSYQKIRFLRRGLYDLD